MALGSSEENSNVAEVEVLGSEGPESIVVSGAVVSIVQVWLAGLWSVLPAWSVARTEKVCEPSLRPRVGLRRGAGLEAARVELALEVALGSSEENSNVAELELVGSEGPESIVVSGAVVSMVQVLVAGVWSVLPTLSVARTENVCEPSLSRCRSGAK